MWLQVVQPKEQDVSVVCVIGNGASNVVSPISQSLLTDAAWRKHHERAIFVVSHQADGVGDPLIAFHRFAHRARLDAQ